MAAIWRTSMPVYLHVLTCTALNWMYNLRMMARKEIQDATDGAGLSGNVKIY